MAEKFTQGTWQAIGLRVKVHGRGIIAECPLPSAGGVVEAMANAEIIAQAPAMYEALKLILSLGLNDGRKYIAEQVLAKIEGKEG